MNANALSLDTSHANTWMGAQEFGAGAILNGQKYSDLNGTGLALSNGVLGTVLGTMVDSAEISDTAVTTAKLADGAITSTKLAANSIASGQIIDGTVVAADISDNSLTFAKLSQNSCLTGQVIKWTVSGWLCTVDAVGASYSAANGLSLTANAFALDTTHTNVWSTLQSFSNGLALGGNTYTSLAGSGLSFTSGVLSGVLGNSVESSEVTDGTILAADFATGAVTSNAILDGTIAAADVAVGAVGAITSTSILDGTISVNDLADGVVTSAKILDGTVGMVDLTDSSVTSAKILDATITGLDIANGTIGTNNVADGAVTVDKTSTAVRKHIVTASIGTIAIASSVEQPIFIAPTNGTITKVTFTTSVGITALSTQGTMSVQRKTATTNTVAALPLTTTGISAFVAASPTLTGGTAFSTGDVYSFKYAAGTIGLGVSNLLVTIEYTASE